MSNIVTQENTEPAKVLTPEQEDVELVRGVRKKIIEHFTKVDLPKNTAEMQLLLATLRDVDGSAVSRMKIQSDEKAASGNTAATRELMTQILKNIHPAQIGRPIDESVIDVEAKVPVLDDSVVTREFVPGEFDQGTKNLTYDEFMRANAHLKGIGGALVEEEETPDT